jgi:glyoxylase-like metal-dependent hydrolase (beta-lactamase superfamily II)
MTLAFLTEPTPTYGTPEQIARNLQRLIAPNPGPMTYHGTNTWLIDTLGGTVVIDPGPNDASHVTAIIAAAATPITAILLTHTHPDHLGATAALRSATGAAVHGWHAPWQSGFAPDHTLADGQTLAGLTAIHTPGHASDHLCFAWDQGGLFSGDHVMSWNTSIVSPPDGDMARYLASLRRLLARDDAVFYCGHGPVLPRPAALMRAMLGHRLARESAILAAVADHLDTPEAIVSRLYADLPAHTRAAAARSVLAHLIKLRDEGRVIGEEKVAEEKPEGGNAMEAASPGTLLQDGRHPLSRVGVNVGWRAL